MDITLSPKRIARILTLVVLCLTCLSVVARFSVCCLSYDSHLKIVHLVDVGEELSLPTWYSASALLLCSILLAAIAAFKKEEADRYAIHWMLMSLIFLYLSLDETALLHERVSHLLERRFTRGGLFYHMWVMPAIFGVLIFVLAYLKFLTDLPARTRRLFVVAGAVYVGGALGLELVGGPIAELYGEEGMMYAVVTHVEEICEMMGIVVFIYALMSYMAVYMKEAHIRISDERLR